MKNVIALICILFACMESCSQATDRPEIAEIKSTEHGITFVVDENLPKPGGKYKPYKIGGQDVARSLIRDYNAVNIDSSIVAWSFGNDSMVILGQDVLFRCIVDAYAEHRPLVLSPDMIWLNICQVFANYANAHAEELRNSIVSHDGKISLVVNTNHDLFSEKADWDSITSGFVKQIEDNTKGGIAKTVVADFSTTGTTERIASGITLMDITKSYFDYVVVLIACGIPEITLTGTPDDWRKVLDKTTALEKYGMKWYTDDIKPILEEFIKSADGMPDKRFWQNMVMQNRPDRIRGGACSSEKPTVFDGWFLRLFPYNKDGKRINTVDNLTKMMPAMCKVPFSYVVIDGAGNTTKTEMEILSGFVGIREDSITHSYEPRIGWIVRKADTEEEQIKDMINHGKHGLTLRVKKVPEILARIKSIDSLTLIFTDGVVLPAWMDGMEIKKFVIKGKMSDEEKKNISRRFPNATFQ